MHGRDKKGPQIPFTETHVISLHFTVGEEHAILTDMKIVLCHGMTESVKV